MNIFSGLINNDFKKLYKDALSALFYDDAATIPCRIYYGTTRYEDCPNCVASPIGQQPSTRYQDGGPIPFPFGSICPMCNGNGKRPVETSETINLVVIWDYKQFVNNNTVSQADGVIQTITFASNTPKLKRAKELVVATDIAGYGRHRFERISEPQPCGFSDDDFVECLWKRAG